jgi:hypothetical protein
MQIWRPYLLIAAALVAGLSSAVTAQPSSIPRLAMSSGSGNVSPSVIAIWRTRSASSELQSVDVLILVRGRPGWYMVPTANRGPSVTSSGYTVVRTATRDIDVRIDIEKKFVVFGQETVDLRQGNVIFVDNVDEGKGPVVIDTLSVQAQIPFVRGVEILVPVLKTPEIRSFLRCEVRSPVMPPRTLCPQLTQP